MITELNSSGGWNRGEVYAGGMHIATYQNGATYFTHSDWLGTERARSALNGTIYSTWTSYPFGEGSSAPNPGPTHFTGKERDTESGNDYFGARYYASSMGRFMSPDWSAKAEPVPYAKLGNPQSLNLYSYMLNNPLSGVDPDGHAGSCGGAANDGSSCVVTNTQISQNVNFYDKQGNVSSTVKVTTNMTTISNSVTGAVVSANASATATNVSGAAFSSSQLSTIGSTIGAVQQAGASMALGTNSSQLMTAITAKESTLGLMAPANPLQLSCSSGTCAGADRGSNIQGALNVLQNLVRNPTSIRRARIAGITGFPTWIEKNKRQQLHEHLQRHDSIVLGLVPVNASGPHTARTPVMNVLCKAWLLASLSAAAMQALLLAQSPEPSQPLGAWKAIKSSLPRTRAWGRMGTSLRARQLHRRSLRLMGARQPKSLSIPALGMIWTATTRRSSSSVVRNKRSILLSG